MNPNLKQIFSTKILMTTAKIGGGIALGFVLMPLAYRILPDNIRINNRRWLGIVNVLVGSLMAGLIRNKNVKDVGIIVAGTGVYDLIASNVTALGLPALPVSSPLIDKMMPMSGSYADRAYVEGSYAVPVAPISPVARMQSMLGASFETPVRSGYGSSYEAPDYRPSQGFGDNPYSDIDGFEL